MTRSAAATIEEPGRGVAQKAGLNREILDTAPALFTALLRQKVLETLRHEVAPRSGYVIPRIVLDPVAASHKRKSNRPCGAGMKAQEEVNPHG
jgi:hypothetical protein